MTSTPIAMAALDNGNGAMVTPSVTQTGKPGSPKSKGDAGSCQRMDGIDPIAMISLGSSAKDVSFNTGMYKDSINRIIIRLQSIKCDFFKREYVQLRANLLS